MHVAVVIPFRARTDAALLPWTLEGYFEQRLGSNHSLEILVGIDGDEVPSELGSMTAAPFPFIVKRFARMGAAGVRNALVKEISGATDLLVFGNADARPSPTMVQNHIDTMARLPAGSLVLGSALWDCSQGSDSILQVLLAETITLFFYPAMHPHQWYDFRMAWTINLSMKVGDFRRRGGFCESLRPVFYEDLDLGYRLMGSQKRVWYAPEAQAIHRHPMSLEAYLDRNELLGIMTPVFARHCPGGFGGLFGNSTMKAMIEQYRLWLDRSKVECLRNFGNVQEFLLRPARTLGQGPERTQSIQSVYEMHLPFKRLAFRLGFLKGLDLLEDSHWQERKPLGLWREAVMSGV